jgi:ketosteroid isomerase-like protein
MGADVQADPNEVLERLHRAMNEHDLDAFLACIHPDYRSEQPAHPNRGFGGREQVRENWAELFAGVPDFHAELLGAVAEGQIVWSEWRWFGTRADGSRLDVRGVTLFGVEDGRIASGRLYMEEVEEAGEDIEKTVRRLSGRGEHEA